MTVDVEGMREAFALGAARPDRHLGADPGPRHARPRCWPSTAAVQLTFPDDLWARVVYDFALGHHYSVVHRDHLLRSLTPLYLGRTAAFVLATATASAAGQPGGQLDAVGAAFERQKSYLVEHWR